MHERMLDKSIIPNEEDIKKHLGDKAYFLLLEFEHVLKDKYDLSRELKFPFGNNYGWGYKYSHKKTHLCYAFFEKNAFTVMLQIGDAQVPNLESIFSSLTPKTRELWDKRYPCGKNGGWLHYSISSKEDLSEIIKLITIKKKPR